MNVESLSVGDIVARSQDPTHPWRLPIVQRHVVWDEFRVAKLLDSMLAGYPIGTLLVCVTGADVPTFQLGGGRRRAQVEPQAEQLLDGQQRTWALKTLFCGDADDVQGGEFFLRLYGDRPEELRPGRRDRRILGYVAWANGGRSPFGDDADDRGEWLSLRALGDRLAGLSEHPGLSDASAAVVRRFLRGTDPALRAPEAQELGRARRRLDELASWWFEPRIPVLKTTLATPRDVLEVFARANMEGVATSAADLFFAAVRTRWPAAEEVLDELCTICPLLNLRSALRLVTRLSSYGLGRGDSVPFDIKKLEGPTGEALIQEMERMARSPKTRRRLGSTARWLIDESGLGYALWFVDGHLLDHVLGWSVCAPRKPSPRDLQDLARYAYWGTALRLYPVLRSGFSRGAMRRCVDRPPGVRPLEALLGAAREYRDGALAYRRAAVRRPFEGSRNDRAWQRRQVVNDRGALFLSVAQELPHDLGYPIDWDHIFPKARRTRLKWRGESGEEWLCYHPDAWAVWRAGNLMALDAPTNRSLQDELPGTKLARLKKLEAAGELRPPQLFLDDKARRKLRAVQKELDRHDGAAATGHLARLVRERELALWDVAAERVGGVGRIEAALFG